MQSTRTWRWGGNCSAQHGSNPAPDHTQGAMRRRFYSSRHPPEEGAPTPGDRADLRCPPTPCTSRSSTTWGLAGNVGSGPDLQFGSRPPAMNHEGVWSGGVGAVLGGQRQRLRFQKKVPPSIFPHPCGYQKSHDWQRLPFSEALPPLHCREAGRHGHPGEVLRACQGSLTPTAISMAQSRGRDAALHRRLWVTSKNVVL